MKLKTVMAAAVLIAVAGPALPNRSMSCRTSRPRSAQLPKRSPTSTDVTVVSGDTVYKTKTEAETGMKTVKVCTSN